MQPTSLATVFESQDSAQLTHPVIDFLQKNRQVFLASPDLLQRTMKYLSAFLPPQKAETTIEKILLPQAHGFILVETCNIVTLEADGSYTKVVLNTGQKILISRALKEFTQLLCPGHFVRIHKSYIVNLRHLKSYSRLQGGCVKMMDGTELLISRRRLPEFLEKMSKITLSFK